MSEDGGPTNANPSTDASALDGHPAGLNAAKAPAATHQHADGRGADDVKPTPSAPPVVLPFEIAAQSVAPPHQVQPRYHATTGPHETLSHAPPPHETRSYTPNRYHEPQYHASNAYHEPQFHASNSHRDTRFHASNAHHNALAPAAAVGAAVAGLAVLMRSNSHTSHSNSHSRSGRSSLSSLSSASSLASQISDTLEDMF